MKKQIVQEASRRAKSDLVLVVALQFAIVVITAVTVSLFVW
ncbi:MAG TPA: hypothetical protein VE616_08615 [Candidatus Udaeobacter sp.]|jgi:hypothetical protein|nr:hypothetical protein [Candidatus Udaeobacter sp.]